MAANTAKQISVQITNNAVFVKLSNSRSFSTIGKAKTIWMPATMSGRKNTVSTCERMTFFTS